MSNISIEGGGGGGISTITEGVTPTSGFIDGYALISSSSKVGEAPIRTILTGNLSLYVNASTGSDSYNGLSATYTGGVNGPFATLQRALTYCSEIDGGGWAAIINIAAGTLEGGFYANTVGLSAIQIYGAGSTSTLLTNAASGGDGCLVTDVPIGAAIAFQGVGLVDTAGLDCFTIQAIGIDAFVGDFLTFAPTDVAFTSQGGNCVSVEDISTVFNIDGTITINQSGVSQNAVWLASGGTINQSCSNIVLSGSANTYVAVAIANSGGQIVEGGLPTYSGSANGPRFNASAGGRISSSNGAGSLGLNFYPGSTAGICDAVSSYDGFPFAQPTQAGGAPTTSDLPDAGSYAGFIDGLGIAYFAVNVAGTIKKVVLT